MTITAAEIQELAERLVEERGLVAGAIVSKSTVDATPVARWQQSGKVEFATAEIRKWAIIASILRTPQRYKIQSGVTANSVNQILFDVNVHTLLVGETIEEFIENTFTDIRVHDGSSLSWVEVVSKDISKLSNEFYESAGDIWWKLEINGVGPSLRLEPYRAVLWRKIDAPL